MESIRLSEFEIDLLLNDSCCNLHRAKNLNFIWNKLSPALQEKWKNYLFCKEHFDLQDDQFDGPIPLRKFCKSCYK